MLAEKWHCETCGYLELTGHPVPEGICPKCAQRLVPGAPVGHYVPMTREDMERTKAPG